MTAFFNLSDLTWPEVAALPRDTPLLVPLGEGYRLGQVADALGRPSQAGILPALPFGWRNSGLAAADAVLGMMVANLLDGLRDDGFSRVYALTPQGLDLGLGGARLALPTTASQEWVESLPADEEQGKVVIIPIGHTEQHGLHLPLSTDTLIIEAIGHGAAEAAPKLATCLPVFPYGVSTHRASFAGTLNCGGRAFEDFWLAIVDALVARGFERFYLISGHGGNCSYLVNVVKSAGERHRRIFCATTWLHTSGRIATPVLQATRRSRRGGMGHAGELETAMILALRPELVHMERAVDEVDFISTDGYFMDWVEGGELVANPPWDDDTRTGAYGAGTLGTAENGRLWLEAAIREKVAHVVEIHEQHDRREKRRRAGFGLWGTTAESQEDV
jgi:creatinine amidohydrolase